MAVQTRNATINATDTTVDLTVATIPRFTSLAIKNQSAVAVQVEFSANATNSDSYTLAAGDGFVVDQFIPRIIAKAASGTATLALVITTN